jgi:amidase
MSIKRPTVETLREVAHSLDLTLSDGDLSEFVDEMGASCDAYDIVDGLPDFLPSVDTSRRSAYRPRAEDNPFNAWYVKTEIRGVDGGKLSGRTIAIKDNIAVAGIPMMNGASTLEGYTPDVDATVVTRVLNAGATIAGKSQCEYLCFSGGSHTGTQGAVQNPRKAGHSAGGSSSGSAALLAADEVDFALGGDQGGSIRTPAAYCGVVGMKPTWGLVPYTGAMPIELTLDHLGPMSKTVADNALLLEVLAGPDGLDPRQSAMAQAQNYTAALKRGAKGLRIGIVREGFGLHNVDEGVDETVMAAASAFGRLGAEVREISVSWHRTGKSIWTVIATEGGTQQLMKGNGHGFNWKGLYVTSMVEAQSAWRRRADELADTVKYTMLLGEHTVRQGGGRYYAKAQNLARRLTAEYDAAFDSCDILLMPTTPLKAPPLPPRDAPRSLIFQRAWENMDNTFPFDLTGHPCLQVPCGMVDGFPIGMMLIGRRYDEATLYRAGQAFEQDADWTGRTL